MGVSGFISVKGCLPRGVSAGGIGGSAYQGCLPRGCLFRGIYTIPRVHRITDRFKNIAFAGGNKVENYKYMNIESWH